jgi:hypothetical protein
VIVVVLLDKREIPRTVFQIASRNEDGLSCRIDLYRLGELCRADDVVGAVHDTLRHLDDPSRPYTRAEGAMALRDVRRASRVRRRREVAPPDPLDPRRAQAPRGAPRSRQQLRDSLGSCQNSPQAIIRGLQIVTPTKTGCPTVRRLCERSRRFHGTRQILPFLGRQTHGRRERAQPSEIETWHEARRTSSRDRSANLLPWIQGELARSIGSSAGRRRLTDVGGYVNLDG